MLTAPRIVSKMKLCQHTTWSVTWSCVIPRDYSRDHIEPIALNHVPTRLEILLFLPLCNSNPPAFLKTACFLSRPAPRLVNNVCSSLVKH